MQSLKTLYQKWKCAIIELANLSKCFVENLGVIGGEFATCLPICCCLQVVSVLTSQPSQITELTIERNPAWLDKPQLQRQLTIDSDSDDPESPTNKNSFRERSISLFSKRAVSRSTTESQTGQNGKDCSLNVADWKKSKKPAVRSNSLPRRFV